MRLGWLLWLRDANTRKFVRSYKSASCSSTEPTFCRSHRRKWPLLLLPELRLRSPLRPCLSSRRLSTPTPCPSGCVAASVRLLFWLFSCVTASSVYCRGRSKAVRFFCLWVDAYVEPSCCVLFPRRLVASHKACIVVPERQLSM